MKIIRKTISALLLAGVGITSIQAQNNSSQAWTLRQCIDYAIEHNIEIRQSANNVEAGKVSVNTTKWARLPNLSGSASQNWSWGRTASPIDNSYSDINSANTSFSLGTNIPIFTGLQLSNQYSLAKLDLKAAIELSKIAHNQVDLSKDQLKRIQGLQGVGKASSSEVAEAQARVAQDEMTAVQSDNTYKLSLLDLTQLLELPTPEGFVLESPKEELEFESLTPPDDIYTQALTYKPSIKAAEYRLQGSLNSIRIAQSAFYPQLSFSAGLGSNYYTVSGRSESSFGSQMKNNLNKYIGFNLSVPIFNRFATRNRVRTARLQQIDLSLKLDNCKKILYKEIQQAWYNALAAESKYNSSEVAVKANEESFRLMSEKFNNGKATFVEYNEAKLNLTKALSDKLQAKYDYLFRTKILDFYKGQVIE